MNKVYPLLHRGEDDGRLVILFMRETLYLYTTILPLWPKMADTYFTLGLFTFGRRKQQKT